MNLQDALDVLIDKQITNSIQMLRRWIRQGKIEATMASKKEGYIVDEDSLSRFIESKQKKTHTIQNQVPENLISDTHNDYNAGLRDGLGTKEFIIKEAISLREKELILKGLKENTFRYSATELLKGFPQKSALQDHLILLKITSVTLNVLGNWIYDSTFNILIEIDDLPFPNRTLKARAKKEYTKLLFEHFESNS